MNMILSFIKNKKKFFLTFFLTILSLWILLLALFPFALSKGLLCSQINKHIKGKVTIKKASLSWIKPQKFEHITFSDPSGKSILTIESLKTSATLFNLLFDYKNLKETQISGLEGYINVPKDKSSNFMASLDSPIFIAEKESLSKKSSVFVFKAPFTGQFHIDNSNLTLKSSDQAPIYFQDIQFNCKLPKNYESLSAHLVCETSQNELSGSMHLNLEMGGFDEKGQLIFTPLDRDIFFLSPEGYLNLGAEITNLPSAGLDHLFALYNPKLNHLFSNAAGGPITCGAHLHVVKNRSKINLTANATDLDLRFSGSIQQNQFFLTEPSTCRFHIKPKFIKNLSQSLTGQLALSIESPAEAYIQVDRLTMPLDFRNFNFSNLSCNAQLSLAPMKFIGSDKINGLEIKQIKGTIDTFDLNENVTMHLNATAYNNNSPVHFKVDGQLSKLIDNQKELTGIDQIKAHFVAQAKDFPTALALHFIKERSLGLELMGPSLNFDTKFNGSLSSADITLSLNSSRIKIPDIAFKLRNKNLLSLSNPTKLTLRVTPPLAKQIFASKCSLLQPVQLKGDLSTCEFKISDKKLTLALLDLGLHSSPFDLFLSNYKPCHINETYAQLSKTYSNPLSIELTTTVTLPQDMPFYSLNKTCSAHLFINNFSAYIKGNPTLLETNLEANNWRGYFNGYIDRKWNYDLLQEANIELDAFAFNIDNQEIMAAPKVIAHLTPCNLNLLDLKWDKLNVSGSFFIPSLNLHNEHFSQVFEELKIPFEYSGGANFLNLSLQSAKNLLKAELSCSPLYSPSGFDFKNAQYQLTANIKKLSPNCFKIISKHAHDYESIFGPHIDLNLKSSFTKKDLFSGELEYDLSSSILQSKGNLIFGEKMQLVSDHLSIDYFVSPASFLAITKLLKNPKASSLLLEEPLTLKLQVNKLSKSFLSNIKESPLAFDGNIEADKFVTNQGSLFGLSGNFNSSNILNNLKVDFSAKTHNSHSQEGMGLLSAELTNPFSFDLKGINPQINGFMTCKLHHFPTAFLSDFATIQSKEVETLSHLLGPSFDMTCSLNLESGKGPLKFEVSSENLFSHFSLNFDQDHLYLEEDLKANFMLNEENMNLWFKSLNPILSSLTSSDAMAKMTISKENFCVPLSPFKLNQVQIESANVDMGKLTLKKNELHSRILKLLKADTTDQTIDIWFTPTHFSFTNGVLETYRTDFLINNEFHLALWGDYNLKQKNASYFLSFPQDTLKKTFGLKKLPPKYMFQIPLKGSLNHLKVDWATAAAQLGILGLTSSFNSPAKSLYQNPEANLNEILDVFAKSQPAGYSPEPLSSFPWQEEQTSQNKRSYKPQKKESSSEEQTAILQDFFKELRKVIQQ